MKTMQTQDQELHNTKKWPAIVLPILLLCFFIGSLFLLHIYSAQEDTTHGTLVGASITGADTLDKKTSFEPTLDPQIGVYMIAPSFSFVDRYQLVDAFTTLQREIRSFTEAVQECQKENTLEACLSSTLEEPSYAAWSIGEDCETPEERLFYDATEMFRTCLASVDSDCVCLGSFAVPAQYPEGEYTLEMIQEDAAVSFSLSETDLSTSLSNMILQEEGEESTATEFTIAVTSKGILEQFGSLEPSAHLYLYKEDAKTISVESQSSYSTYETTRSACSLSQNTIYKLCVQSNATVQIYDEQESAVVTKPNTYTFAIEFE